MKILVTILAFCTVKAFYDAWRIRKGIGVNHGIEWLMLAGGFVATDYLLHWHWFTLAVQAAGSWIYFDALLNVLRGKPVFYVGQTAYIDVFFRTFKEPEYTMVLTKIIVLFIVVYSYIIFS